MALTAVADDRGAPADPDEGGATVAVQNGLIRVELDGRWGVGTFHGDATTELTPLRGRTSRYPRLPPMRCIGHAGNDRLDNARKLDRNRLDDVESRPGRESGRAWASKSSARENWLRSRQ